LDGGKVRGGGEEICTGKREEGCEGEIFGKENSGKKAKGKSTCEEVYAEGEEGFKFCKEKEMIKLGITR